MIIKKHLFLFYFIFNLLFYFNFNLFILKHGTSYLTDPELRYWEPYRGGRRLLRHFILI